MQASGMLSRQEGIFGGTAPMAAFTRQCLLPEILGNVHGHKCLQVEPPKQLGNSLHSCRNCSHTLRSCASVICMTIMTIAICMSCIWISGLADTEPHADSPFFCWTIFSINSLGNGKSEYPGAMWVLQGHTKCSSSAKSNEHSSQTLLGTCTPEKNSCLVNILLGPLPGNESLQQVAYAKEDKPCVMGILVIAIAKLCILETCTFKWQPESRGCGIDADSYSDHLSAFRVLQVMCCLVAVSEDAHGQKR